MAGGVSTIGYGAWTDAFVKDLVAMLLERISATLSFGRDGEKAGSLGNLGQWAQQSGVVHPDAPTNGVPYNNQFLMMFMGAFSGGTEDLNQITIDLSIDNAVVIYGKTNSTPIDSIGMTCFTSHRTDFACSRSCASVRNGTWSAPNGSAPDPPV